MLEKNLCVEAQMAGGILHPDCKDLTDGKTIKECIKCKYKKYNPYYQERK